MPKTLKDIVKNSSDIFFIKVDKPSGNKHNKSSWQYIMVDPRWDDDTFKTYRFKTVHLRRDNSFFMAYKSDDSNAYFVDPRRAMYRNSVKKYVNSLVDYSVRTNDISLTKNEPSFRVTEREMKYNKIDNFLDLCYEYKYYSAIGTGYTRNIRNLVVMDIDVDCSKPDNKMEIDNLLLLFAKYDSLPDFYIYNHKTNHIQLQWLIKDLMYKDINNETINNVINELNNDTNKNKEIDYRKIDFTDISELGIKYRKYTYALCDIVNKRKFGDKSYTFWKAKNPMSALVGAYDLELFMPYYDGEIKYRSVDEMNLMFSSKEGRRKYFENAPDITQWYDKLFELMDPLVKKVTEKKVRKVDDAEDVTEVKKEKKTEKKQRSEFGKSRNQYVLSCTRQTTWEIAKKYGIRTIEDINKLRHNEFNIFKKEVYSTVYQRFRDEDERYGGVWPETSNITSFSISEFKKTFDNAFSFATQKMDNHSYNDEDRMKSKKSRKLARDLKLIIVDKIKRKSTKITRKELLTEVNKSLLKIYVRKISMGSLKRFIAESNNLTDEERSQLQTFLNDRKTYIESRKS